METTTPSAAQMLQFGHTLEDRVLIRAHFNSDTVALRVRPAIEDSSIAAHFGSFDELKRTIIAPNAIVYVFSYSKSRWLNVADYLNERVPLLVDQYEAVWRNTQPELLLD